MTLLFLLSCTGDEPVDSAPPVLDGCLPSEDAYDAHAAPLIEASCGGCHGSEPLYGAPYSLVEGYDDLVIGAVGERKVDAMLAAVLDGSMPPENVDQLEHVDLDTLVGWLSCGEQHPPEPDDLQVDREVWQAPQDPPEGAEPVDLLVGDQVVELDDIDDYRQFEFTNVVDEELFIRRIEPIVDESRVLHHITLVRGPGFPYLYAWAPGTGAIEFPDGGMDIGPGDSFVLEVHYNNGAGVPDAVDNSGLRLWVSPREGTEYGMASPALWNMSIPPGEQRTFGKDCKATMDFTVHAAMPHMHEIGATLTHTVERSDGSVESLVTLTGWSFESQYFYEIGMDVKKGDTLRLECGYDNTTDHTVNAGLGTSDEMCFDFLVVTPVSAAGQCAF